MNMLTKTQQGSSRLTTGRHLDLLAVPGLRHFLLWKYIRTAVQIVLFALAAIRVVDGLLGNHLAARNSARVAARLAKFLTWALILLIVGVLAILVLIQPMEMRGNALG